uniref:Reverse transcriptase domain-containing protein n=1 Tax=Xenopus tropicalis TaxID=8364 RepID=A0A803JL40_XENTR
MSFLCFRVLIASFSTAFKLPRHLFFAIYVFAMSLLMSLWNVLRDALLLTGSKSYMAKNKWRGNLNAVEKEAIKTLKQRKDIIVRNADKGGGVVVMNYGYYKNELLSQLSDPCNYGKLTFNPTSRYKEELMDLLNMAKTQGWITDNMLQYLVPVHPTVPVIYTLPKVHKNLTEPPGRPIISSRGSLNERIAQFVDFLLQPCVKTINSYVKDTNDFLKLIKSITAPLGEMTLVTMDVQSLYTCIPHQAGLSAVRNLIVANSSYKGPPIEFTLSLLEFILHKNYFKFENQFYIQRTGTAMGSRAAPSYANAYMWEFENSNIYGNVLFRKYGAFYRRYIDDIFFIWEGSTDLLDQFVNGLNQLDSPVKLQVH